jgi:hypothetical protein
MSALQIENTEHFLHITLDKRVFDETQIIHILERLRTEDLIQQAQFDESILELAKTIKKKWWAQNKDLLLK